MAATHLLTLSLISLLLVPSLPNPNPNFHLKLPTSFSINFFFFLSPHSTLSLFLIPNQAVQHSDPLTIDFASNSITIRNKSVPLPNSAAQRLHAFVDYRAGSRLLEVRMDTGQRLVFPVDLFGMWKAVEVLVELKGSSNSTVVYTSSFRARNVPKGMHSIPIDPRAYKNRNRNTPCYLTAVSALMIATGCCLFVVFMVMFFKVVFTDWEEVLEMEYAFKPTGKGYELVGADVENNKFGSVKC